MRRHPPIWIVFLTCLTSANLHAQQLIFKNYTVNDGLVANPVRRIFQDSKGFLWISTWDGISKYDGHKFTNYTTANGLAHNLVNDFYESEDGELYLAENNGRTEIIQNGLIKQNELFPGKVINRFYKTKDNRILVLTDSSGIYELRKGQLQKVNFPFPKETFNDVIELNDSLLAFHSLAKPLIILNSSYQLVGKVDESNPETLSFHPDDGGKFWLGTAQGLKNVSFFTKPMQVNSPKIHLSNTSVRSPVTCILKESDGDLWVGTTKGLMRIKQDGRSQLYTMEEGLPSNRITFLLQDKEKNIWIGTWMGLAKIVTRNKVEIYTAQHGLGIGIQGVFPQTDNKLLVFCDAKIQELDPAEGSFKTITHIKYPAYYLVGSSNIPMLATEKRILVYDSTKKSFIERFKISRPKGLFCALVLPDRIIIGSEPGLIFSSGDKVVEDIFPQDRVSDLVIDKEGYLWISTWSSGLYRVKADLLPNAGPAAYQHFLAGVEIRSLLVDRAGNIWAGTRYKGVFQLHHTGGGFTTIHYDHKRGLTSSWIATIAEDTVGNIWLGSILGLDKLIKRDTGYEVFNFSRVNNCFQNIYKIGFSRNNDLWCSTSESLVHITDNRSETLSALPIYITEVGLGGKKGSDLSSTKKISLKHNENQANFEFTAPGFINEKQILYSYRLMGTGDTSWSTPTNIHQVSYASLQPGNYNFQVRTVGWNGKFGDPARFSFNINPPFWKTAWFMSLIALAIFALLYILYRYRIQQIMQLQKVRTRLATDLHDDIGSTLTNINILSELSKRNLQEPTHARVFLQRITEEVTSSGQALDDIIWSVNARNDTMEEIIARMRRYAADLFDNSDIQYQLDLADTVTGKKLGMEQRRDVYLIYKESLNNIYKHAGAKRVWIKAAINHHMFEITIKDDGKGFDISQPTHRNGLKNLRERVRKWNGKLVIESALQTGTTITIAMPV